MLENIYKDVTEKMEKALSGLKGEYSKIRTGRASPALLDTIRVDYYGNPTPLTKMATVSAPEARLLVIQPWDQSSLQAIEKAIQKSELGLTPMSDGKIIRLPIPPLTEDRRKDLVKLVHKFAEEGRVGVRNIRRHAMEDLKKEGKISEDDQKRAHTKIQTITDDYVKKVDALTQAKSKEVLEV
ncbi:MAG: ribosome recycling factor [Pseudomonadota bacterium]